MNTDGLRGFTTLRTRPLIPMSEQLQETPRYCIKCGARLRRTNPGPTCATPRCSGIRCDEPTDWERALIESSPHGAKAVAVLRNGQGKGQQEERNETIRDLAKTLSRSEIAERFGISKGTVNDIIWRRYQT